MTKGGNVRWSAPGRRGRVYREHSCFREALVSLSPESWCRVRPPPAGTYATGDRESPRRTGGQLQAAVPGSLQVTVYRSQCSLPVHTLPGSRFSNFCDPQGNRIYLWKHR